jgi:hypothetical protein
MNCCIIFLYISLRKILVDSDSEIQYRIYIYFLCVYLHSFQKSFWFWIYNISFL